MFKQFVNNVAGADVWMVASMVIFILFFAGVLLYLIKGNKDYFKKMEKLPIE
jgi:hypothetical protein